MGGGPVGLALGCYLTQAGLDCRVLEQRLTPTAHSRSIGIHPVSLERLDEIGVTERLLQAGRAVRRAHAFRGDHQLGTLSFELCPPPYPFVLTLPQRQTEEILEQRLRALHPAAMVRGAEVLAVATEGRCCQLVIQEGSRSVSLLADFVVGCDGKNSTVRRLARIRFVGSPYPWSYLMGDFTDETGLGDDAAIYLHADGATETFPLPGNARRWVIQLPEDEPRPGPESHTLQLHVARRTHHDLSGSRNLMVSSFGVQHYLAAVVATDRIALAGDAAHVLSPFGAQGMNLGWRDAWHLARCLRQVLREGASPGRALAAYDRRCRKSARRARRRAELFMLVGHRTAHPRIQRRLLSALLSPRLRRRTAEIFTMRGIEGGPL